ncbi:MAG: 2-C-methyl-D-erythritol 2,4-cyclodiphosphate synthase [Candidatus Bipolaricaulota bacterium]|jgi:2-C-methyl-D-erythritol 2,4-cyclodiphosphate synthase|nr:2-C-methyl-D-erythritol 2,4-cyclodiphosphate synthase [Candidatus Bipolaricaulota bacterium]
MTEARVGLGIDFHRFAAGRPLVLGGVTVPHSKGLLGHSDADALIHALCDSLLGAAGESDIGVHFPDSDSETLGISSLTLLAAVMERIHRSGWHVVNVDCVVVAEEPKLAPHVAAMRETLGPVLGVGADRIGLKATTSEGMGALGRREGIGALAVSLIERASGCPDR